MSAISFREVLRQLKADLIGKDSHRGITLTYAWMANQFGHFSLGFIPTLFVHVLIANYTYWMHPVFWSALIVCIGWFVFELCNFLGPLLLRKGLSKSKARFHFQPDWKNIAFDTFTDLCFFWLGTFVAALYLSTEFYLIIVSCVLGVLVLFFSQHWYRTKMYLQAAQYPFQFRLSQWMGEINESDIKTIHQFLDSSKPGTHLFVYGSKRSGKTSLGIGIGTELSIRHNVCLYTTAMKLYCMFFEDEEQRFTGAKNPWNWRDTSLLIIDDINPGQPIMNDIVTAEEFLKIVDTFLDRNDTNRSLIRDKRVIWVLGNENREATHLNWQGMLEKIEVKKKDILCIRLSNEEKVLG